MLTGSPSDTNNVAICVSFPPRANPPLPGAFHAIDRLLVEVKLVGELGHGNSLQYTPRPFAIKSSCDLH
jgi:hypothetical protein